MSSNYVRYPETWAFMGGLIKAKKVVDETYEKVLAL